ncbi:hypothetical protein CVT24_010685 [Panaeolus cyanescens]|uniref:Uncharacterized protein n=1 Tax=Panaeolus cyanescens TaxID=181874 RepID=A0A409WEA8_9AGAR|nr:hypothetical protein CVT24_010685 [Panaeolus cyanescens]
MDHWANRTNIPLTTADALGATYARAHKWFQALKVQLINDYNWTESSQQDQRMLFSLETCSILRSSVGIPAGPKLKLQLPVHASSFFSPERRVQWEMVFHSDIFDSIRSQCPPIRDILNLTQCLLTGLVTIVMEETVNGEIHRTIRGLPPLAWVNTHEAALLEVFGQSHFKRLRRACADTKSAYSLEIEPRSLFISSI